MKKMVLSLILMFFLFMPFLAACSKKGPDSEKGGIEELTEETGKAAVESIRRPIDKARALQKESSEKVNMSDSLLDDE